MFTSLQKRITLAAAAFAGIVCLGAAVYTQTANAETSYTPSATRFQLIIGKSTIIKSPVPVKRVSIGNPEIADFVLLSPRDIYATGKAAGATNLTLWSNGSVSAVYELEVIYDVSLLKQQLHNTLPEEQNLHVTATNNSITLSGRVSNSSNLSKALALAGAFAPAGKVNNLVEVGGVHQVMLEVRVAEIARSTTKRLGINFNAVNGNEFGVSMLGGLSQIVKPLDANIPTVGAAVPSFLVSPSVNALFRFNSGSTTWTGIVDALREDGLAKILAEPTLIALSGKQASFLAGGEFPVPVPQGLGTVAIEYKKFGVGLNFTPTVLGDDRINIQVTPEVSELDFSTAVQFSGFVIPGLTTRTATTTVELRDGQSFAIAGLLRDTIVGDVQKFPLLGSIPILGALFRSESFQKNESELIIVVTTKLAKPLDMARQSLPTDFYTAPSDYEFYLEGLLEGKARQNEPQTQSSMDGEFGHSVPDLEAAAPTNQ